MLHYRLGRVSFILLPKLWKAFTMGSAGRTDFLFAMPSFLSGVSRALDLGATFDQSAYNLSQTTEEADTWALANDWAVVGQDLRAALKASEDPSAHDERAA